VRNTFIRLRSVDGFSHLPLKLCGNPHISFSAREGANLMGAMLFARNQRPPFLAFKTYTCAR